MPLENEIRIEPSPAALALLETLRGLRSRVPMAIQRGMKLAAEETVLDISAARLSGQGPRPFPVEEHRLRSKSSKLKSALRQVTIFRDDGGGSATITSQIGANIFYGKIHEFGKKYTRKAGSVRLKTKRNGELLTHGNLAIFASKSAKQVRVVPYAEKEVEVPARSPVRTGIADNIGRFAAHITEELQKLKEQNNL